MSSYYMIPFLCSFTFFYCTYYMSGFIYSVFSTLAATWFCMFDLFLSVMVFHVYGHFNILLCKLNSFPRPTLQSYKGLNVHKKYSNIELQVITDFLKDCVDYHKLIVWWVTYFIWSYCTRVSINSFWYKFNLNMANSGYRLYFIYLYSRITLLLILNSETIEPIFMILFSNVCFPGVPKRA